MPDLLSHVLLAYAVLTVASWRLNRLTDEWIAVGVAGAAIPDLIKAELLVDSAVVSRAIGVPFDVEAIGTLGGVLLVAGVIALAFGRRWRPAYAALVAGGGASLVFDGLRAYADGRASFWLYPIPWRPPTPSLYVSSDPAVLAAAALVAGGVAVADRRVGESADRPPGGRTGE
ncbi:hypothetical protein [Halostella salina]|uniref:hypothetical protein n=1 Tax=Halostella salina TaxID=1547897 RepID=UPI000EF7A424|nr:hypothetical protein [Halostella salina]